MLSVFFTLKVEEHESEPSVMMQKRDDRRGGRRDDRRGGERNDRAGRDSRPPRDPKPEVTTEAKSSEPAADKGSEE